MTLGGYREEWTEVREKRRERWKKGVEVGETGRTTRNLCGP